MSGGIEWREVRGMRMVAAYRGRGGCLWGLWGLRERRRGQMCRMLRRGWRSCGGTVRKCQPTNDPEQATPIQTR